MKKSLLILGGICLLVGNASANDGRHAKQHTMADKIADYVKKLNRGIIIDNPLSPSTRSSVQLDNVFNEETSVIWCPGKVTFYTWNNNDWREAGTNLYTYNADGQILTFEAAGRRTTYTYDDQQRVASELSETYNGQQWVADNSVTYAYDPIITDLVVATVQTFGGQVSEYGKEITRDADGNITSVKDYNKYGTGKTYDSVLSISYGKEGTATSIEEGEYDDGRYEINVKYNDVTWQNTDGQIYEIDIDNYDADSYFGNNRIKSATVVDDEWPKPATLNVTYNTDNTGFRSLLDMEGDAIYDFSYTPTDDYGSYEATYTEADWENENGYYHKDFTDTGKETYQLDKFGLLLLETKVGTEVESDGSDPYNEAERGTVTYDATTGNPAEYILEEANNGGNYRYVHRRVYSDYATSAVSDIEAEDNAPAEYFNLQGIRVSHPDSGIFIRRQGNSASKITVITTPGL